MGTNVPSKSFWFLFVLPQVTERDSLGYFFWHLINQSHDHCLKEQGKSGSFTSPGNLDLFNPMFFKLHSLWQTGHSN